MQNDCRFHSGWYVIERKYPAGCGPQNKKAAIYLCFLRVSYLIKRIIEGLFFCGAAQTPFFPGVFLFFRQRAAGLQYVYLYSSSTSQVFYVFPRIFTATLKVCKLFPFSGLKKTGASPTYCSEAAGSRATISEPKPLGVSLSLIILCYEIPSFQNKTQSQLLQISL